MTPAIRFLEKAAVAHQVHPYRHDPETSSYGDEVAAALGVDPAVVFKTLVLRTEPGGGLVMALVPVSSTLDPKALARAAGAKRASMADPAEAQRATGYVVGGISPLGQRRSLPAFLDESALDHGRIYVSAGRRGLQVSIDPGDLKGLIRASTAALAARK